MAEDETEQPVFETSTGPVRVITAASLFDGHDAAINVMRRLIQSAGAEVIHLGHDRSAKDVVDCAIQVHGAKGVTDDTILASYYRHERAARIYDGADEVHKSRLARQILKKYALNK